MDRVVGTFEVKRLDAATGEIAGYGSVFHVTDSYADVVMPGAFTRTLSEAQSKGRLPAMLWQHDATQPIGVWTEMAQDERGLRVKGTLAIHTRAGRDAYELMKLGALRGLSIGYRTRTYTWDETRTVRHLTDVDLIEVSPVVFPANEKATITAVKEHTVDLVARLRAASMILTQRA